MMIALESAVKRIPGTYTAIDEADAKKFQKMLDLLEDDDVQEVYHNAEFLERILKDSRARKG